MTVEMIAVVETTADLEVETMLVVKEEADLVKVDLVAKTEDQEVSFI
jgi:hypothetical protein